MKRRLLLGYLALALMVLVSLEVPLAVTYGRNEQQDLTAKVERDAVAIASLSEDRLEHGGSLTAIGAVTTRYQRDTGGRVVIVDTAGNALVDTSPTEPGPRNFASRPEIATALTGRVATGVRTSLTLRERLLYVAVPVASSGAVHGAIRITYPMSSLDHRILRYWLMLLAIGAVVLLATTAVGLRLARSIAKPLLDVERAAEAVGDGDLEARAPEAGPPEVRALARAFNETVGKLDLLVRSQEAFVADASHELRTPLTALALRLENLERDVAPAGRESLAGAVQELTRLSQLVEGLLALARADASGEHAGAVDVAEAAAARAEAWREAAEQRGVTIEASGTAALARAAPLRVEQVLDNLIANALDVSPSGATIAVSASRRNGWVELRVADEGPGMSAEDRTRAFDRFWRARPGGSGLGLAIVRRLVVADGGEVELLAAGEHGLEAVVRLRPAVG